MQHPREAEHRDDLRRLRQTHPRARALETQLVQLRRRVGIKCAERNVEQRGGEKHHARFAVLQQRERIQAQPFAPRKIFRCGGHFQRRQKISERRHQQPDRRAEVTGVGRMIQRQRADQQRAAHPAERRERADGAVFFFGIRQPRQHDGRGDAEHRRVKEIKNLDETQHQPAVQFKFQRRADACHQHRRGEGQPAQHFGRRHMPVGHRAKNQRGNERRHRHRRERIRLDVMQPVRIQNRAERHEPDGHAGRLDEK